VNQAIPRIQESVETLRQQLRQAPTPFARQRVQALYLLPSGQAHPRREVAALVGVPRETVGDWLRLYAAQGLTGLLQRRTAPGATPTLNAAQQARLQARLQQPEGFGSYREIQVWLAQEFPVTMPYKTVFSLVHDRLGARPKVAQPHAEKKTLRLRHSL
jgi:transposase